MAGKMDKWMGFGMAAYMLFPCHDLTAKDTQKANGIASANPIVHIEDTGCRDYNQMAPKLNFSPAYTLPDCKDKYLQ